MTFIPGFDDEDEVADKVAKKGGILTDNAVSDGQKSNALNIGNGGTNGAGSGNGSGSGDDDDELSHSIQEKFRGFSYSGTYDGSVAGSFGGRRGSGGFGLGGASLGMSRMHVDDSDGSGSDRGAPTTARAPQRPSDTRMSEAEEEAAGRDMRME